MKNVNDTVDGEEESSNGDDDDDGRDSSSIISDFFDDEHCPQHRWLILMEPINTISVDCTLGPKVNIYFESFMLIHFVEKNLPNYQK